jgi:ornithine cyclodeaminase/alanine dehydrogenase-like protein (mu-crystallin family)
MHFFDEAEIAGVQRMADLIPVMRRAMIDFSTGRIAQPAHRLLEVEPYGGCFAAIPAVDPGATTVFESIGFAAQDTAAAMMVANKLGLT